MQTEATLPIHVGIIMDGNGRWAKARHLPRNLGHKKGAETFEKISEYAADRGIQYLTVYAFSTENWNRPKEEVDGIFRLLRRFLADGDKHLKKNMRLRLLGERTRLPEDIRARIVDLEQRSSSNTGMHLNIALNYGGREELLHAAKTLVSRCQAGGLDLDAVDEPAFGNLLYTAGQPDVDLVIRTSGEQRISNFLLWQSAYAEYVFTDVLWPDFTPERFDDALRQYAARNRRLGGV